MAYNFSFVIPGKLAGMAYPGSYANIESDLDFLVSQKITGIVNLTSRPLGEKLLKEKNLICKNIPIRDFHPPTMEQIDDFINFVEKCLKNGGAVVAHCGMGQGRTGTMLACYLVHTGMEAKEAINKVRKIRPHSIETSEQENAVKEFSNHNKKKVKK